MNGGPVVTLADGNMRSSRGTWTEDGFILFTQPTAELPGQILRVRADGGTPEPLPGTDEGRRQTVSSVSTMPGTSFLLLTVGSSTTGEGQAVAVQSLENGERRVLAPGGSVPRLLAGGQVVYRHSGRLMAGRLDAGATRLVGTPIPLDAVIGGADVGWFDVSPEGTLVFLARSGDDRDARFARTSRDGLTVPLPAEVAGGEPRLSPDGTRLVFDGPQTDVWVLELERGALVRISSAPGEDETGAWSPDGRWIAWTGSRPGEKRALFRRRSDGSGPEERLWSDERHLHVASWTPTGIVVTASDPKTGWDVLLVDPDKGEAKPVLDGRFHETSPRVSPDGRLLAFVSDETGRNEVYVRTFPEPGGKVQVSIDGGVQPVWRPGTREIVYRGSQKIMSATLGPGDAPAWPRLAPCSTTGSTAWRPPTTPPSPSTETAACWRSRPPIARRSATSASSSTGPGPWGSTVDRRGALELPGHGRARRRRDGRGVARDRHEARARRRPQAPPRGLRRRTRSGWPASSARPASSPRSTTPASPTSTASRRPRCPTGRVHFLVMELVEGEDLAERLKRGPVPVDEALAIARQVAEALEEAHEKGIVHRDLKPANVKVTPEGKVKVLDFGLAKAWSGDGARRDVVADLSQSPTLAHTGTAAGIILGTAAYMSPEQARGKAVDKRADIWAFGVLLYEMLTGRRLFTGETVSDILAAVLRADPDWKALPADTPPPLLRLLRRCLARDPRERLRDIGDAVTELREAAEPARHEAVASPRSSTAWVPWTAAALACAVAAWAAWRRPAAAPAGRTEGHFTLELPAEAPVVTLEVPGVSESPLDVSPDGRQVVYVAPDGRGTRLYARAMADLMPRPLPGTEGGRSPFFSPDGQWVGFFADGRLKKVPLAGGTPVTLAEAPEGYGASWTAGGEVVFTHAEVSGLSVVSDAGGTPRPVTALDVAAGDGAHRWPQVLPGGRAVLFTVLSWNRETSYAVVADLGTGARRTVLEDVRRHAIRPGGAGGEGGPPRLRPRGRPHGRALRSRRVLARRPRDRRDRGRAPGPVRRVGERPRRLRPGGARPDLLLAGLRRPRRAGASDQRHGTGLRGPAPLAGRPAGRPDDRGGGRGVGRPRLAGGDGEGHAHPLHVRGAEPRPGLGARRPVALLRLQARRVDVRAVPSGPRRPHPRRGRLGEPDPHLAGPAVGHAGRPRARLHDGGEGHGG